MDIGALPLDEREEAESKQLVMDRYVAHRRGILEPAALVDHDPDRADAVDLLDVVTGHGYVLTPGRYVCAEKVRPTPSHFAKRFAALQPTVEEQFAESATG